MKILFLCVANSARSQIAEGLAKAIFGTRVGVWSAGSAPSGSVHPCAIKVMTEVGINISDNRSKSIQEVPHEFLAQADYVITLCEEEVCPALKSSSGTRRLHWPVPDPVAASAPEQMSAFRFVRNLIHDRLIEFHLENRQ